MYCNEIFLGGNQYGFAAAAEYYFGKDLKDINIEEAALLAALPRSPTNYSPILNPERAKSRRNYAIDRMVAEGKITVAQGEQAKKTEIKLAPKQRPDELAPYFVEEIRQYLDKTYGRYKYLEGGLKVYSTLNVPMQNFSNAAVRQGLRDYDKRHGWRGPLRNLVTEGVKNFEMTELPDWKLPIRPNDVVPGIVISTSPGTASVRIGAYRAVLMARDVAWTGAKASPEQLLKPGDVALFQVRTINPAERKIEIMLDQIPKAQGALVSIEPQTGEIKALWADTTSTTANSTGPLRRCARRGLRSSPSSILRLWTAALSILKTRLSIRPPTLVEDTHREITTGSMKAESPSVTPLRIPAIFLR